MILSNFRNKPGIRYSKIPFWQLFISLEINWFNPDIKVRVLGKLSSLNKWGK